MYEDWSCNEYWLERLRFAMDITEKNYYDLSGSICEELMRYVSSI